MKPKLVVVDELGYIPFKAGTASLFHRFVSTRYESGSIMVTTSRPAGEWGIVMNDVVLAGAVLDRFLHSPLTKSCLRTNKLVDCLTLYSLKPRVQRPCQD